MLFENTRSVPAGFDTIDNIHTSQRCKQPRALQQMASSPQRGNSTIRLASRKATTSYYVSLDHTNGSLTLKFDSPNYSLHLRRRSAGLLDRTYKILRLQPYDVLWWGRRHTPRRMLLV